MTLEERVRKLDDESFMCACLKMARSYIGTVENELQLYETRSGHKKVSRDFQPLFERIDKLIRIHRKRIDQVQKEGLECDKKQTRKESSVPLKKQRSEKSSGKKVRSSAKKKARLLKRRA